MIHRLLVLLLLLSFCNKGNQLFAQDSFKDRWEFIADSTQRYGFDHPPKKDWFNNSDRVIKNIPYVKSIRKGSTDPILVRHPKVILTENVTILINDSIVELQRSVVDDSDLLQGNVLVLGNVIPQITCNAVPLIILQM